MDDGEGFDIHAYRHRLKLLRESTEQAVFEHRGDRPCPVCAEDFTGLIRADGGLTIPADRDGSVCVDVAGDDLLAFVH